MTSTIQSLIDDGMKLWATCDADRPDGLRCGHARELDLRELRDRLGPDHPAMAADLAPRLRCSVCDGKSVQFTLIPGNRRTWDLGDAYRRARDGR